MFLTIALYLFLGVVILADIVCLLGLTNVISVSPQYLKKRFGSLLLTTASLTFLAVRQGLASKVYIRGDFYPLSNAALLDEQIVVPSLPAGQDFYSEPRPRGGDSSYDLSWILTADDQPDALLCKFQRFYQIEEEKPRDVGASPFPVGEAPEGREPAALKNKRDIWQFSINLKAIRRTDQLLVRYKTAPPPNSGSFEINGVAIELAKTELSPPLTPRPLAQWRSLLQSKRLVLNRLQTVRRRSHPLPRAPN